MMIKIHREVIDGFIIVANVTIRHVQDEKVKYDMSMAILELIAKKKETNELGKAIQELVTKLEQDHIKTTIH